MPVLLELRALEQRLGLLELATRNVELLLGDLLQLAGPVELLGLGFLHVDAGDALAQRADLGLGLEDLAAQRERVDLREQLALLDAGPLVEVDPPQPPTHRGRDDEALRCEILNNQTGVDYKAQGHVEIVYHLYSYTHRHYVILKARVPRDDAVIASVESVWKAANWLEREIFDLLGVTFVDHSDLRRLMMPEDWVGHPLRKDFVEPEEYHGISTTRESLLR